MHSTALAAAAAAATAIHFLPPVQTLTDRQSSPDRTEVARSAADPSAVLQRHLLSALPDQVLAVEVLLSATILVRASVVDLTPTV